MRRILVASFVVGCIACNRAPTTPSFDTRTATVPLSVTDSLAVQNISVSGNTSLGAVGETSQLKAVATFADGTTKDVTADGTWIIYDTSVITVTQKGLVTATKTPGQTQLPGHVQVASACRLFVRAVGGFAGPARTEPLPVQRDVAAATP